MRYVEIPCDLTGQAGSLEVGEKEQANQSRRELQSLLTVEWSEPEIKNRLER